MNIMKSTFKLLIVIIFTLGFVVRADSAEQFLNVTKWACVQSKQDLFSLVVSKAEMIVVDPDEYSRGEVRLLQRSGKKMFAYLSMGEAEEYRKYFKSKTIKSLIIKENPEWKGNYPIKYWTKEWQDIISSYSSKILMKGFDGLYLDVVDAWEAFDGKESEYRERMANFLYKNANLWRKQKPGLFLLFQNSDQLFNYKKIASTYDGIVQEGLFANWAKGKISQSWQEKKILALKRIKKMNKFVGLLEYTRNPHDMAKIKTLAKQFGFAPYFSVKDLNKFFEP